MDSQHEKVMAQPGRRRWHNGFDCCSGTLDGTEFELLEAGLFRLYCKRRFDSKEQIRECLSLDFAAS